MRRCSPLHIASLALALVMSAGPAATETIRMAVGQQGIWETSMTEMGVNAGLFKAEGLEVDILYTRGGAETIQALLSGNVDIAVANGILGAIGSYTKGAPLRMTAASTTGTSDVFWYSRGDSDIRTIADAAGKRIGFSQPGSSTHLIAQAMIDRFKIKAILVPSGSPSGSYTMTMSRQIDLGWSVPPFRLQDIAEGKLNMVVRGGDIPGLQDQTVRVHLTTADTLKRKRDLLVRYHRALARSIDYAYADEKAMDDYARIAGVTPAVARQVRDFIPKETLQMREIKDLDQSLEQAFEFKFTDKRLKSEDLKGMIEILVPR